jgi:hypothetical protein
LLVLPRVVVDALAELLATPGEPEDHVFAGPHGGALRASLFRSRFWGRRPGRPAWTGWWAWEDLNLGPRPYQACPGDAFKLEEGETASSSVAGSWSGGGGRRQGRDPRQPVPGCAPPEGATAGGARPDPGRGRTARRRHWEPWSVTYRTVRRASGVTVEEAAAGQAVAFSWPLGWPSPSVSVVEGLSPAALVELAPGLEPGTCCLQDSCAADCATPAVLPRA